MPDTLRSALRFAAPLLALALAAACEPRIGAHGFVPNPERVAQVRPGAADKLDVSEILGTPSAVANFDASTWYYISQRSSATAFFKPEIVEQIVLAVRFDDNDTVAAVDRFTLEDGRIVEPVERQTPTAGNELTLLQQLFGNIGRFSN